MPERVVTVFGGTGFLGLRVVRRLLAENLAARIAARHPDRHPGVRERLQAPLFSVDVRNDDAVATVLEGAYAAVNAVSLYVEHGADTFHAVHVDAAERLARQATRAGLERLVLVSGIGADAQSPSRYIRCRGEGERAVQSAFANTIIVRPAVMFGRDDALITTLVRLLRRLPAFPMFGQGQTRLQPVHVEDVATAITRALEPNAAQGVTYELGGPRIYTYEELVRTVAERLSRQPPLLPIPFPLWHALARIGELLPAAPLSRGQVELMQIDSIVSAGMPGFAALGMVPQGIAHTVEEIIAAS
jgi:uncharacterized protein YbjT (DUF2867 family)